MKGKGQRATKENGKLLGSNIKMTTQAPKIKITKEIISKGDERLSCSLCDYGKKAGIILWRVEFSGECFRFHWILCNRCRFILFKVMGGKRIHNLFLAMADSNSNKTIEMVGKLFHLPKQKLSNKGAIKSSYYHSLSPDRQEALDSGISLREYENKMFRKMDKIRKKKKKKIKKLKEHDWDKMNLITISDKNGMYDKWECINCKKKVKRYGLQGRPDGGKCPAKK